MLCIFLGMKTLIAHTRQHSESGFDILVNWGQFLHLPLFLYWGLEVLKKLNLKSTDIREITLSLNIKLRISKVSNEVEIAMTWLINDLNNLKNFPRTIIYSNSITDASEIYIYITSRMFRRHECFIQKVQSNARLWLKGINSKMGIVITTNAQGMSIVNCYSIVLYGSYPHTMFLTLYKNLAEQGEMARTLLPWSYTTHIIYEQVSLKEKLLTFTDCCKFAMLNVFLKDSDLQQVPNKTHKFCNICASKCS